MIKDLNKLSLEIKKHKLKGKVIGLCHGVFDLIHYGHIAHFEEAKNKCDILVVSITTDKHVNKGPGRPYFNIETRIKSVNALECVDYVVESKFPTSIQILKEIKPDIYFKGPDYKEFSDDVTKNIFKENNYLKSIKSKLITTEGIKFSSSSIINQLSERQTKEQKFFLKNIKKKFELNDIIQIFEQFKKLKILVLGEVILDQYQFCDTIGKSGKEPYLVLKSGKEENYLGGSLAVARHLSNFCSEIKIIGYLGESLKTNTLIKKNLEKNIKLDCIRKKNSPTIIKKRIIDNYTNAKILGLYDYDDRDLNSHEEKDLIKKLKKNLKHYDLILNIDYGHGFVSKNIVNYLKKYKNFLSINAQINASNRGYHGLFKYKNVNLAVVNELELRYELRDKAGKIETLINKLQKKIKSKNIIITRGIYGAIIKSANKFTYCPAFSEKIVDKVGAGDTLFAISSVLKYLNVPDELNLLIGSLAASQTVKSYNNKFPVSKIDLLKSIKYILA